MGLIITKVDIECLERVMRKFLRNYFTIDYLDCHSGIEDWDFVIFEQYETHAQLRKRKILGSIELKSFTGKV